MNRMSEAEPRSAETNIGQESQIIREQREQITGYKSSLRKAYASSTLASSGFALADTLLAIEYFADGKILQGSLTSAVGASSAVVAGISENLRRGVR